jgi:cellulose synthase/poly-beta-1,6-N-acetylglucosamine synthase-like glycosyltransferase
MCVCIYSIPFALSESILVLLGSAAIYLQVAFNQPRTHSRLRGIGVQEDSWPTVDVMIPCYTEPIAVRGRCRVFVGDTILLRGDTARDMISSETCDEQLTLYLPILPVQVIEQTIRAALELEWPANKLTVILLDDGGSPGRY